MKDFKFKTRFEHIIKASEVLTGEAETSYISKAADIVKNASELSAYVDLWENKDLMAICCDLAVVNQLNNNGDGINSNMALYASRNFINKPINIAHDKSMIVGHILTKAYIDPTFRSVLDYNQIYDTQKPFFLSVGGVIYKLANDKFTELLMKIKDGKESDTLISASWEVAFNDFDIAIGSKNIEECEIISDEEEKKQYIPYLKSTKGGSGVYKGRTVGRLLKGEIIPLGLGLTQYPAADVKGIFLYDWEGSSSSQTVEAKASSEENNSQNNKSDVTTSDDKSLENKDIMEKLEIIKLIEESIASQGGKPTEEAVASMARKIADAIVDKNDVYLQQKQEIENKAKEQEALAEERKQKVSSLEAAIEETNKKLSEAESKLQVIEAERQKEVSRKKFDERMSTIDSKFDLTDDDRKIIATKVEALKEDGEFDSYLEEMTVLLKNRTKDASKEVETAIASKVEQKLKEELEKRGIKDPLEGKKPDESILNNSAEASSQAPTLKERFAKAFGGKDSIKTSA
jgi:hypothetical protein